ncbi:uncharacterized protein LOC130052586 isoform X2 [Ostrea edulis]|uniref:uncharacterized protein LOC130052586 isoform X2 n=1 Tax=Ostrea edulis TaxID=37623 RepID=UPI0024AF1838|nr:uncharacterized protein LOC130052586 isoform X2 [Ostrea edulis]
MDWYIKSYMFYKISYIDLFVCFYATLNNFSVIWWCPVFIGGRENQDTTYLGRDHRPSEKDSDEEATPCTTETQPVAIHRTTHSSVDRTTKKLNPETRNSESLNINDVLLVLILVFGSVDFILCCTYLAVGFYERRHTAAAHVHEISDTTGDYRGNDTSYENVEINLPSTSGVGVRVSSSAMPILERACDI